ncbi:MAG: transposase [Planctomycetes bacterium]|nr:transposase [Planctomycetota bacterium]
MKFSLPEVLAPDLVDQHHVRLRDEWHPSTPTEEFLVREMARHETALDRAEQIEAAILRRGSRGTPTTPADLDSADAQADAALAGAGITDALERISRYRRLHERAFHKSHGVLVQIKAASSTVPQEKPSEAQSDFQTEAECEKYLAAREWRCPYCGSTTGRRLPSRKAYECKECRRQSGLRAGTVMARSGIPLITWFRAIGAILMNPTVSTAELGKATGIDREGTIRRIARRIREAMALPDASTRLMGLDRVFLQPRKESGH